MKEKVAAANKSGSTATSNLSMMRPARPGGGGGGRNMAPPPKLKDARGTLLRLGKYILTQKWLMVVSLVAIVLATALQLVGPMLLAYVIDHYILPMQFTGLGRLLLIMIGVYLIGSGLAWAQDYLTSVAAQKISFTLRQQTFKHLERLPLSYFDHHPFGELMSRITNDVSNINTSISDSLGSLVSAVFSVLGSVGLMFYLSPLFALVTLIFELMILAVNVRIIWLIV